MAAFLGIDGDEMAAHPANKHVHPRLTEQQVDQIRHIEGSPLRRLCFRWLPPRARWHILGLLNHHSPRARATFPERWIERITELTAPGNRRLMERWGLELGRHEYPLQEGE